MRIDRNTDPAFIGEVYEVIDRLRLEFEFDHLTIDQMADGSTSAHFRDARGYSLTGFLLKEWWFDLADGYYGTLALETTELLRKYYPEVFI